MPPLIIGAAVSALIGTGLAVATGVITAFSFSFFALSFAANLALGFLSQLLSPKPKTPNLAAFTDRESGIKQTVRNPVEPRRVIYGERLVSGPLVFATTAGTDNKFLHLVIVLMHGAAQSIGEIQFNDEVVGTLDGGGNVTSGRFSGKARIKKHLGEDDQAADTDLVADVTDWTTDHRLRGLTYLYVTLEFDRDVYPTGIPNIKAVVKGRRLYDTRSTTVSITSSSVANPTVLTTGTHTLAAGNRIFIKNHTGSTPAIAGEFQVLSAPTSTTVTIDVNVTVGGTGGTLAKMLWTDNAALALQDFLVSSHGLKADAIDEVNASVVTTAGNICDEEVNLSVNIPTFTFTADPATDTLTQAAPSGNDKFKALHPHDGVQLTTTGTLPGALPLATTVYVIYLSTSTFKLATSIVNARAEVAIDITDVGTGTHTLTLKTQPRYTTNGVILLNERPIDIVPDLIEAMFGILVYTQGQYTMFAGAFTGPATVALDESNLRGKIDWLTKPSKKDLHNGVRGVFVDRDNLWATTEFPPVTNASFETLDGGERIFKDVEMAFITDSLRAQRIGKLINERDRQSLTLNYPCNLTALEVAVMDVVDITNDLLGFTDKEFEVLNWNLTEDGGVNLVLKETAAGVYTFDPDADTTFVDLAPNTNLPDPFTIQPPTGLTLTSGTVNLFLKADGTVVSRIKATWTAAADPFVELYEVEFKKTADSTFEPAGFTSDATLQIFIFDVEDGIQYDVQVRSISHLQVRSTFATASHTVVGKTAVPANVASLTAQQNGNVVVFKWPQVADLDLAGYEIRFGPQGSFVYANAIPLTEVTRGTQITTAAVPPGTHTFGIKATDTSGNVSTTAATANLVVTNQQDIVISKQYDPDYTGTLVNLIRHWTGKLVLEDQTDASGNNFNVFENYVDNPFATASFEATEVDLGFDADNVRVFSEIVAVLGMEETAGNPNPQYQIDFRDEANSYDGFEDWTIGTADFRRLKSKLVITTADGLPVINSFKTVLDVGERTESDEGVSIGVGGTTITFATQFHTIPNLQITVQGTTALFAVHSLETVTSFKVQVFNTSGTDVGGIVDWVAIGA